MCPMRCSFLSTLIHLWNSALSLGLCKKQITNWQTNSIFHPRPLGGADFPESVGKGRVLYASNKKHFRWSKFDTHRLKPFLQLNELKEAKSLKIHPRGAPAPWQTLPCCVCVSVSLSVSLCPSVLYSLAPSLPLHLPPLSPLHPLP